MPQIDDVKGGGLRSARRQAREASTATPLSSSSVGRGGLRVHSGGKITIQNGGLSITGTAEVIGKMIGSGELTWSGPVTITGDVSMTGDVDMTGVVTISGPLNIIGAVDITDDLDISGNTTITGTTALQDDMTVSAGGKIIVDNMTIGQTPDGGGLEFDNGAIVAAEGNAIAIYSGTGYIAASPTQAVLNHGGNSVAVNSTGAHVAGSLYLGNLPTVSASGKTPNLWIDPATDIVYKLI